MGLDSELVVYKVYDERPKERVLDQVVDLAKSIFGPRTEERFMDEIAHQRGFTLVVALVDDKVIGFKAGYQERRTRYYSWLGAVHPDHRRRGIGREMMRLQHEWCAKHGYQRVQTRTKNRWRDMLILNLHFGFDIIGTSLDTHGDVKVLLEKKILPG